MIPQVRTWQITLDDGTKHLVLAPTKFLAKLNFRFDHPEFLGRSIKSIGLKRS